MAGEARTRRRFFRDVTAMTGTALLGARAAAAAGPGGKPHLACNQYPWPTFYRREGREFHHMMLGTDPQNVTFCLDAHWIYRGSGDSAVALFDVLKLYGRRVTEVHLRQSAGGVWTEALAAGDVDYPRLARSLLDIGVKPHLVIEQAVEKGTPQTMGAVEAIRKSRQYAERVFAAFAG